MKKRIYEAHFKRRSEEYDTLQKFIKDNYIDKVVIQGEGLLSAATL